jgi:hypothetical protein
MSTNPILGPRPNTPSLVTAETTIVNHLPSVLGKVQLPVNGEIMTTAQLVAVFQGHLDSITKVTALRAQLKAAIQSEDTLRASAKSATICLRNYVAAAYGDASTQYASLGFTMRKLAQKSAEKKALAVEKLRATREARHTMGKVQKSKITGQLPGTQASLPAGSPAAVASAPSNAVPVVTVPAATATATAAPIAAAPVTPIAPPSTPTNGVNAAPSNGVASGH